MLLREQMAQLVNEMLDGRILLSEAMSEFENLYIELALERNSNHISKTAQSLGVHRNTLSKRVSRNHSEPPLRKKTALKRSR
ncbi:MAG TPA: hypothetical protein DEA22_10905 [Blastocatellia bacterium]|nr:hypothetical protein [Blastocatellia bacterium]